MTLNPDQRLSYIKKSPLFRESWPMLLILVAIAFVLYIPVISNSFLADDYTVMYRVGVFGNVFVDGFFRPLSDVTLYINYFCAGFGPSFYYITNIAIHAGCSFLIFLICGSLSFVSQRPGNNNGFKWIATILFITYPFHNESIAWIVGRASLLATFFGLLSLYIAISEKSRSPRYLPAGLCYFIGLMAYESIFPLPAIALIFLWKQNADRKKLLRWCLLFGVVLLIHFAFRIHFAGVVAGDYAQSFKWTISGLFVTVLKITGRLILPPSDNTFLLTLLFVIILSGYVLFRVFKTKHLVNVRIFIRNEVQVLATLFLALLIPFAFNLSARTSEGDRLLYFPSVFFTMYLAMLVVEFTDSQRTRSLLLFLLVSYNIVFLEINNSHWRIASAMTRNVISDVKKINVGNAKILLIGLPGEFKGAFALRGAFSDALLLNNIDTGRVKAISYVGHAEYSDLPEIIEPVIKGDSVLFGLSVIFKNDLISIRNYDKPAQEDRFVVVAPGTEIWYWNKKQLRRFKPS